MKHIRIEEEVEIEQPPYEVYGFLADQEHRPAWSRSIHRARRLSDDSYRMVGSVLGRRMDATYHVLGQEPDESYSGRLASPRMPFDESFDLVPIGGDSTHVQVKVTVRPEGRLSLLAPVLGFALRQHARADLRRLKLTLEGPKRAHPPAEEDQPEEAEAAEEPEEAATPT